MIEPSSTAENFMYCTTRICGNGEKGNQTGTGFFFNCPTGDKFVPIVVTNKHVVRNTSKATFRIHTKTESSPAPDGHKDFEIPGALGNAWTDHPNPAVDLCAIPIGPTFNSLGSKAFFRALDPTLIPQQTQLDQLDAIEDITMVGYPIGLWDETNNFPLIRRGITATHPAVDFNGRRETVVDIACFPGSSGSPVFIFNKSGYSDKKGNTFLGNDRLLFLGVLYAGPVMHSDGKIVIRQIPTASEAVPQIDVMINLGYIIKSEEVKTLQDAVFRRFGISSS